jgi:predicted AlkP superfamily pyrophosphatase or phosphodiesterase
MYVKNAILAIVASLAVASARPTEDGDNDHDDHGHVYKHAAFFSVDGLHASDIPKWVAMKPKGTIAKLLANGYWYQGALTAAPSDSFPGTINLVAGATPAISGIWYDDSYGKSRWT